MSARFYRNPMGRGLALRAVCLVRLLAKGINHSRRRLSRIPSPQNLVAPAEICSAISKDDLFHPLATR
jgi:hypothetical protein